MRHRCTPRGKRPATLAIAHPSDRACSLQRSGRESVVSVDLRVLKALRVHFPKSTIGATATSKVNHLIDNTIAANRHDKPEDNQAKGASDTCGARDPARGCLQGRKAAEGHRDQKPRPPCPAHRDAVSEKSAHGDLALPTFSTVNRDHACGARRPSASGRSVYTLLGLVPVCAASKALLCHAAGKCHSARRARWARDDR